MSVDWGRWLRGVARDADLEVSALTLGDASETISSRLGKAGRGDFGPFWACITWPLRRVVNTVAWLLGGAPDHCAWAIDDSKGTQSPLR